MGAQLAQLANFTVLQTTAGRADAWSRLGGLKDDVFVFDR
jgi:hypothetical protein